MPEEGYTKYSFTHEKAMPDFPEALVKSINSYRAKLKEMGLIGILPEGIGFGNLSVRYGNGFVITASSTGHLDYIHKRHLALVRGYSFEANHVNYKGLLPASSESLSHAALYEGSISSNAVIHAHSSSIWKYSMDICPATPAQAEFGTPELALSLRAIACGKDKGIIITQGHENGVFTFGMNLAEAFGIMADYYAKANTKTL
ncbi:MAG: class II aldolase/adducin family protein [Candidatus Kapaibacterium sp.]